MWGRGRLRQQQAMELRRAVQTEIPANPEGRRGVGKAEKSLCRKLDTSAKERHLSLVTECLGTQSLSSVPPGGRLIIRMAEPKAASF